MTKWYALIVTSGRELGMIDPAFDWGCQVEAYTPVETRFSRKRKGEQEAVSVALFPGYVFVRCEEGVLSIVKAKSRGWFVLGQNGYPAPVSALDVMGLRGLESIGAFDKVRDARERFAALIGKTMVLRDGPLAGFTVTVDRAIDGSTVEVSGELGTKPFKAAVKVTADMVA
jgi:transcription antitermination factor NusG